MAVNASLAILLLLAVGVAQCTGHAARLGRKLAGSEHCKIGTAMEIGGETEELELPYGDGNETAEIYSVRDACADRIDACDYWVSSGYCQPQFVYQGLPVGQYWCKDSCEICDSNAVSTPAPPTSPQGAASSSSSAWMTELLGLVNSARAQSGLGTLCRNAKLNQAAQGHSDDQAARRTMTHNGGDGRDLSARVTDTRYNWFMLGENVAYNQQSVQQVFDAWMASQGHRQNIMQQRFTHMGAGRTDNSGYYWTQVFGASTNEPCP